MSKRRLLTLTATLLPILTQGAESQTPPSQALPQVQATATITVSDETLASADAANPIGTHGLGAIGAINYASGNYLNDADFEPYEKRDLRRITATGDDDKGAYFQIDQSNTSNYLTFREGAYSGTDFRAFRFLDSQGQPLPIQADRKGELAINSFQASQMVPLATYHIPSREQLPPHGGWTTSCPATWEEYAKEAKTFTNAGKVYYRGEPALRVDDVVIFKRTFMSPDEFYHDRIVKYRSPLDGWICDKKGKARLVLHQGPLPDGMPGGKACVELTAANGVAAMEQALFTSPDREVSKSSFWYGQLEPGRRYLYEGWIKGKDLAEEATVQLGFATNGRDGYFGTVLGETFTVTNQWQRYRTIFTAPSEPVTQQGLCLARVLLKGQGSVLVDNLRLTPLYQPGEEDKRFTANPQILETLLKSQPASGPKGHLRFWTALNEREMKRNLSWSGDDGEWPSIPKCLTILEQTGTSAADRMVPWINVQMMHSEAELQGLVEYLCGSFDPATDTAATKPWAAMRVRQRGHNRPWSQDFREIIIELGNESWHNRKGKVYIGVGRYGGIHRYGHDYGLYCRHLIRDIKASPAWNDTAAAKLRFAINGNYGDRVNNSKAIGYGSEASLACGIHDYLTHANYFGPKWELNEKASDALTPENYQKYVIAPVLEEYRNDNYLAAVKAIQKAHPQVRIAGYEGGPSGYDMKNKATDSPDEIIGHSKASAVAAADIWLSSRAKGWVWQTAFLFKQGTRWCLFEPVGTVFRPRPAWVAMSMVNRLMTGDMKAVTVSGASIMSHTEQDPRTARNLERMRGSASYEIPMVAAYATRTEDRLSVLVLNRSIDRAAPVILKVPGNAYAKLTRHWLSGNYDASNADAEQVVWKQESLDMEKVREGKLMVNPCDLSIFTFEK